MFYCVLFNDDSKLFDIYGPISNNTRFIGSVCKRQNQGLHIHCGTVDANNVNSIEELKKDSDTPGYMYHAGLIKELRIQT